MIFIDDLDGQVSDAVRAGNIQIQSITGDNGRLSCVPESNCAGIAGKATLELLGVQSVGIVLNLHKGLPLGSGLGSSAASAAAAAAAVIFALSPYKCETHSTVLDRRSIRCDKLLSFEPCSRILHLCIPSSLLKM